MIKMTMKEQLAAIFEADRQLCVDAFYTEFDYYREDEFPESLREFKIKCVDHYGGEGKGDRYDTTYSFTKDGETLYIKFYGWYASYVGAEYEGFNFVTPREKTIIEYS